MSSQPTGWQTPKTNWKSADVPLPTDFDRIEGNIQAIESGSRTLDPSQVPSGNSGSLRQILSWFANRIRAITGADNWYDAPATTLAATKSHMDATSGVHGATSSAIANRLVLRDASGRAKFADPIDDQDVATKGWVLEVLEATGLKRVQRGVVRWQGALGERPKVLNITIQPVNVEKTFVLVHGIPDQPRLGSTYSEDQKIELVNSTTLRLTWDIYDAIDFLVSYQVVEFN